MKFRNKNDSCDSVEAKIDQDEEKSINREEEDLSAMMENLICNLVSNYERYNNENKTSTKSELEGVEKEPSEIVSEVSGSNLFNHLINSFNSILKKITSSKRNEYLEFVQAFQRNNFFVIQLFELASQIIGLCSSQQSMIGQCTALDLEQATILRRTIELLHVLTTSNFSCLMFNPNIKAVNF